MRQTDTAPTREEVDLQSLPFRREYLQTLREWRDRLREEIQEAETLLGSTLLFETEEEDSLRGYTSTLKTALSQLESGLSLLEENIRRVEEVGNIR